MFRRLLNAQKELVALRTQLEILTDRVKKLELEETSREATVLDTLTKLRRFYQRQIAREGRDERSRIENGVVDEEDDRNPVYEARQRWRSSKS